MVGIDVGAATAKAVIFAEGEILGHFVMATGHSVELAARRTTVEALRIAGLPDSLDELDYVVSTGYGRNAVAFANRSVTEITCHAKGASFMIPEARTVIDIGGQDSKGIEIDEKGNVKDFIMNDKCAAGTGRFLEVMAAVLEMDSIDKLGPLSLKSTSPCRISSTCTVFAESEVVSLRAAGRSREDLAAGIHRAIASRVAAMIKRLKIRPEVVFTGGVAKNIGVKKALEEELGIGILVPQEPQIIGALGAALLAWRSTEEEQKSSVG